MNRESETNGINSFIFKKAGMQWVKRAFTI